MHAHALLTSTPEGSTDYVEADVRDPDTILEHAAKSLDFDRPVGLMMLGIAGQLPDADDPWSIVRRLLAPLSSGSFLALCDGTDTSPTLNEAIAAYNANSASSYHLRGADQIARFFEGLEVVEPGVVSTTKWRPDLASVDGSPQDVNSFCGVGRKR